DIVEADYRKYIDAHIEKGKKVSDSWVETALKNGTSTPNFSTSGVDKNTILDVIGTFMTNKDVKNGKVSLENIFEVPDVASSLVESMKQKADDFLLDEDTDEDKKEALVGFIEDMRNTYDDFTKEPSIEKRTKIIKAFTEAFEIMRTEQARRNDEAAPQHYGLPEDSEIKFDNFSKRADEEIEAHKNRRKLRRNI
ncbi:MAG: hypothetical protein LUB59_01915, partial [Candidatus Gastranaerophilales bacterium]|nr:hypothetical protein [Candidatus Gastranaerophilales bacterium]